MSKFLYALSKRKTNFNSFIKIVIIESVIFCVLSIFFLDFKLIFFVIFIPIIVFYLNYYYTLYLEDLRQRKIELDLKEVISEISLIPDSDIFRIIKFCSNPKYKFLSEEFNIINNQIKNGIMIENAFFESKNNNGSFIYKRYIDILVTHYKSGRNMSLVYRNLSDDILKLEEIERDKNASLSIQKYTIIASATILLPLILSWTLNIANDFSINSYENYVNVTLISYIYLIQFSVLSSIFLSVMESNFKKFVIYLIVMLPISLFVFNV